MFEFNIFIADWFNHWVNLIMMSEIFQFNRFCSDHIENNDHIAIWEIGYSVGNWEILSNVSWHDIKRKVDFIEWIGDQMLSQ